VRGAGDADGCEQPAGVAWLATQLRAAGINTEVVLEPPSSASSSSTRIKAGIRFAVMLGENELAKGW
jgi:histidyl-tRNA synthetase